MQLVETITELRAAVKAVREEGQSIGCVPTMGALHEGHLSLVDFAQAECDFVVTTIFVNPTQFGPNEDFSRYPRPLENDLDKCRQAGVDLVFHPSTAEIYPREDATFVEVPGLSNVLEGAHRPGHFRGVSTVVLKLLNMVLPDVAFFGQKDFQQQLMIRQMVADLDIPVEIRTCPTIREEDGLALSSRNAYLSQEERTTGLEISRSLKTCVDSIQSGVSVTAAEQAMQTHLESTPGLLLDYAVVVNAQTLCHDFTDESDLVALVAAKVGATRLIDNMPISRG